MPVRRGRTKRAGRLELEIRELIVAGIVRPEDTRQQVMDVLLPF